MKYNHDTCRYDCETLDDVIDLCDQPMDSGLHMKLLVRDLAEMCKEMNVRIHDLENQPTFEDKMREEENKMIKRLNQSIRFGSP